MFKSIAIFALVALCASKSIDKAPADLKTPVELNAPTAIELGVPFPDVELAPSNDQFGLPGSLVPSIADEVVSKPENLAETIFDSPDTAVVDGSVQISKPLPVEVAKAGIAIPAAGEILSETIDMAAPAISMISPIINLPKGPQEVVDIPHADIKLQGNGIENKDIILNLPSPIVEAPQPIIRNKEVVFRLPQPIFYITRPIIQHKPMVYRLGHTLRAYTPIVKTNSYIFKVPQAQITGKSAYTQPIPAEFINKPLV